MSRPGVKSIILILALVPSALSAEKKPKDESLLTLERIFASSEFAAKSMATRWAVDGNGYLVLEDAAAGGRISFATTPRRARRQSSSRPPTWYPPAKRNR